MKYSKLVKNPRWMMEIKGLFCKVSGCVDIILISCGCGCGWGISFLFGIGYPLIHTPIPPSFFQTLRNLPFLIVSTIPNSLSPCPISSTSLHLFFPSYLTVSLLRILSRSRAVPHSVLTHAILQDLMHARPGLTRTLVAEDINTTDCATCVVLRAATYGV